MNAHEFRTIRTGSGLKQGHLARLLGYGGAGGNVTISRYESGTHAVPGPVALLMRLLAAGRLADEVEATRG